MNNYCPPPVITGRLWSTDDPGAIPDAMARGFQVIAIVDTGEAQRFPNCSIMSNLLPPPESLTAYIDGNVQLGKQIYTQYLLSKGREDSIAVILAALHKKKDMNFLLYVEYEPNMEFHILETIIEFFYNIFGIVIGIYGSSKCLPNVIPTPQNQFAIVDILFCNGYINKQEYALIMPKGTIPSDRAASILLRDLNYGFNSMEECLKACVMYLDSIRTEALTGAINPVMVMNEKLEAKQEQAINNRVMESQTRFG